MQTLGILLFPEFETLDVFGPIEMFGQLKNVINIVLIAEHHDPVESVHGQRLIPDYSFSDAPSIDILLIPGGMGTRKEIHNILLLDWIKRTASIASLVLTVCTGAALLAKTGLLDNLEATTNKMAFDWVKTQGPKVQWKRHARWVDSGHIISSSGISAGIDMSLYVIARLFGIVLCNEIAFKTEYIGIQNAENDPFA